MLQTSLTFSAPQSNQKQIEEAIINAPKSDIYVLPEMWSTGFATPEVLMAHGFDYDNDDSLLWMQQMAERHDCAIAGSLSVKAEDGTYRNRFYFVTPSEVYHYDKHHLFTYSGEDKAYTAGKDRVIVEWRGVKYLLQVCYDLRFPCFSRNAAHVADAPTPSYDYDCIIYVASWPTARIDAWRTLLKARALENQCYVIGVNRIGTDPFCSYSGGTMAFDAYGHTVAECEDDKAMSCSFPIDLEKLYAFRKKFPVLLDR